MQSADQRTQLQNAYIDLLWDQQAMLIQDPPFTLKSGRQSYVYANHRDLICLPSAAALMVDALLECIARSFDVQEYAIAVADSTVSPLLGAMCAIKGLPLYISRPVSRERGIASNLFAYDSLPSPDLPKGLPAIVIDDVITTTSTVGATIETLETQGRPTIGVACLLDRRVTDDLGKNELQIASVATLEETLTAAVKRGRLTNRQTELVSDELLEVRRNK